HLGREAAPEAEWERGRRKKRRPHHPFVVAESLDRRGSGTRRGDPEREGPARKHADRRVIDAEKSFWRQRIRRTADAVPVEQNSLTPARRRGGPGVLARSPRTSARH